MQSIIRLDIPRRNSTCEKGGERLLPGMEIYSVLLDDNNDKKMSRRDFCSACWDISQYPQNNMSGACGYWKSKIETRKKEEDSSRIECALSLLRSSQHSSNLGEAEIFVLCLLLSRARRIALRQEFKNDQEKYQLYEVLGTEEFLKVKVVTLSDSQISQLQTSLAEHLHKC